MAVNENVDNVNGNIDAEIRLTVDDAVRIINVHREFFGQEVYEALTMAMEALDNQNRKRQANKELVKDIRQLVEEQKVDWNKGYAHGYTDGQKDMIPEVRLYLMNKLAGIPLKDADYAAEVYSLINGMTVEEVIAEI